MSKTEEVRKAFLEELQNLDKYKECFPVFTMEDIEEELEKWLKRK